MAVDLKGLAVRIEKQKNESLAFAEYGQALGFLDVEQAKQDLLDSASKLVSRLEAVASTFDEVMLADTAAKLSEAAGVVETIRNKVQGIVKQGVNETQYPNRRTQLISQARQELTKAHLALSDVVLRVSLKELERRVMAGDLSSLRAKAESEVREAESVLQQLTTALDNVRSVATKKAVVEGATNFDALSAAHGKHQNYWFVAFLVCAGLTVVAVLWAALDPIGDKQDWGLIAPILRRLLFISTPAVLARVCLAKYNVERNLKIIYDHRSTVLDQFRTFEAAIGESDAVGKNQLRLEIAKYLFSDPQTGYGADSQSEFNINPVVNLVEKLPGKAST